MDSVKLQRKLWELLCMNRIVGLASGAIKKGCRKNQIVRGTI